MLYIYNTLLKLIWLVSHVPIYPKKYQKWFENQKKILQILKPNSKQTIWIHCSSLGEYENIKPLISELKTINSSIHLTFFSPSGYDYFKDFNLIKNVSYLPIDIKSKMNIFIQYVNPVLVIISKNDIWPNMISILKKRHIPIYLIGCKISKQKSDNFWRTKYYEKTLKSFSHIFCEDVFTYQFLEKQKIKQISIIQNTRINQILIDKKKSWEDNVIKRFIQKNEVIIYGSIEKGDYDIILNSIKNKKDYKHIVFLHEPTKENIKKLKKLLKINYITYSDIKNQNIPSTTDIPHILIVDMFGILKNTYQYSHTTYIGGGFDKGIHNTLEPAFYGNFIFFGPKYKEFTEAIFLIKNQIAVSIQNKLEFEKKLEKHLKTNKKKQRILNKMSIYARKNKQNITEILKTIKKNSKNLI